MTQQIKVMDQQLANMIAAGEVVERPSGIVKELIENALDAQASHIQVEIEEGGMRSIKVIDNGMGMSKEDLQNAFKRHSTSKVFEINDLNHITTFGFRGEALPSIASVSMVTMNSNDSTSGHEIVIDNGKEISLNVFARNKGTSITVAHLFSKVPARLKYIKNPKYETSIIVDIIQKFAMGHSDISFSLKEDGKELFKSFGNKNAHDVFYRVFGREPSTNVLDLKAENIDFKIEALFAQPQHTRSNRHSLWLYINDRMIRNFKIQNAIVEGFRRHIPNDRFPMGVLKIYCDPQLLDVNVHPSKWEIRLSKESDLISLIINTIEGYLTQKTKAPRIIVKPEQTTMLDELLEAPKPEVHYEKKIDESPIIEEVHIEPIIDKTVHIESSKEETSTEPVTPIESIEEVLPTVQIEPLKVLAQMSGKYILAQAESGLYIIDQHASMERVRYEHFQDKLLNQKSAQQPLLIPLILDGRGVLVSREKEVKDAFEQLQVDIEILDNDSFVIRERPVWMKESELLEFANKVLDYLEDHKTIREEDFRNHSLATLACHSSVRFNEYMSMVEMETLVEQLRNCSQPFHCPHGRPTFMVIDHDQLWKGFLR